MMGRIVDAVQNGSKRDAYMAIRDDAAATLELTESARDKAALINRLLEVMDRLDAMPDPNAEVNPAQRARQRMRNRGKKDS
jgi:hypothetical protein